MRYTDFACIFYGEMFNSGKIIRVISPADDVFPLLELLLILENDFVPFDFFEGNVISEDLELAVLGSIVDVFMCNIFPDGIDF